MPTIPSWPQILQKLATHSDPAVRHAAQDAADKPDPDIPNLGPEEEETVAPLHGPQLRDHILDTGTWDPRLGEELLAELPIRLPDDPALKLLYALEEQGYIFESSKRSPLEEVGWSLGGVICASESERLALGRRVLSETPLSFAPVGACLLGMGGPEGQQALADMRLHPDPGMAEAARIGQWASAPGPIPPDLKAALEGTEHKDRLQALQALQLRGHWDPVAHLSLFRMDHKGPWVDIDNCGPDNQPEGFIMVRRWQGGPLLTLETADRSDLGDCLADTDELQICPADCPPSLKLRYQVMATLLQDADPSMRIRAIHALGNAKGNHLPFVLPLLASALDAPAPEVVGHALAEYLQRGGRTDRWRELGGILGPSQQQRIAYALRNSPEAMAFIATNWGLKARFTALRHLLAVLPPEERLPWRDLVREGLTCAEEGGSTLRSLAHHPVPGLQQEIEAAILRDAANTEEFTHWDLGRHLQAWIACSPAPGRPLLQAILDLQNASLETNLARGAQHLPEELALWLLSRLRHVKAAWDALGERGSTGALNLLVQGAEDPDPEVRLLSLEGLIRHPSAEALPPLLTLTEDPDDEIRATALNHLGQRPEAEAREALFWNLASSDVCRRRSTAIGLLKGHPDHLAPLVAACWQRNPTTRTFASAQMANHILRLAKVGPIQITNPLEGDPDDSQA